MARTLEQVIQETVGIGRKEAIRLSSFLGADKLKSEFNVGDAVYGEDGILAMSAKIATEVNDKLTESGKEMLNSVQEMMKESVGKNATETREILLKMKVLQETLGKATDEQSKAMKKVVDKSVETLEGQGGMFAITKEVLAGRVEGFKDKMIRKIPLIGGILGDIRQKRRAAKLGAAKFGARLGGAGTAGATIVPSEASDIAGEAEGATIVPSEAEGGSGLSGTGNVNQTIIMLLGQIEKNTRVVSDEVTEAAHEEGSEELEDREKGTQGRLGFFGKAKDKIKGLLGLGGAGGGAGGYVSSFLMDILGIGVGTTAGGIAGQLWQGAMRKGVEGSVKAGWFRRLMSGMLRWAVIPLLTALGIQGIWSGITAAFTGASIAGILPMLGSILAWVGLPLLAAGAGAAIGTYLYDNFVGPWQERMYQEQADRRNLRQMRVSQEVTDAQGNRIVRNTVQHELLTEKEARRKYGDKFDTLMESGEIQFLTADRSALHGGLKSATGIKSGQTIEEMRERWDSVQTGELPFEEGQLRFVASQFYKMERRFRDNQLALNSKSPEGLGPKARRERVRALNEERIEIARWFQKALTGRGKGYVMPAVRTVMENNPDFANIVRQRYGFIRTSGKSGAYDVFLKSPMLHMPTDIIPSGATNVSSATITPSGNRRMVTSLATNALFNAQGFGGGGGGNSNNSGNVLMDNRVLTAQNNNNIFANVPTTRDNTPTYIKLSSGHVVAT